MVLLILLAAAVAVSLLIGVPAKMTPKELVAQSALMCLAALAFYGLTSLL